MKSFLTYEEVAQTLCVSLGYVRILKSKGTIQSSKRMGKLIVVPRAEVERLLSIGVGKSKAAETKSISKKELKSDRPPPMESSLQNLVSELTKHLSLTNKVLANFTSAKEPKSTQYMDNSRELKRIDSLEKELASLTKKIASISSSVLNIEKNIKPTVVIRRPGPVNNEAIKENGSSPPIAT